MESVRMRYRPEPPYDIRAWLMLAAFVMIN